MPFLTAIFLLYIGIATILTFTNQKYGVFHIIVIVAIQDPIRKMHPGAPSWFVLSAAPVMGVILLQTLQNRQVIKDLYNELDLKSVFEKYEEQSYTKLVGMIAKVDDAVMPKDVYQKLLDKIYKRKL